jgi:hypothetical protein
MFGSFDRAIAFFAGSYANQNECDYEKLVKAVDAGQIKAATGI